MEIKLRFPQYAVLLLGTLAVFPGGGESYSRRPAPYGPNPPPIRGVQPQWRHRVAPIPIPANQEDHPHMQHRRIQLSHQQPYPPKFRGKRPPPPPPGHHNRRPPPPPPRHPYRNPGPPNRPRPHPPHNMNSHQERLDPSLQLAGGVTLLPHPSTHSTTPPPFTHGGKNSKPVFEYAPPHGPVQSSVPSFSEIIAASSSGKDQKVSSSEKQPQIIQFHLSTPRPNSDGSPSIIQFHFSTTPQSPTSKSIEFGKEGKYSPGGFFGSSTLRPPVDFIPKPEFPKPTNKAASVPFTKPSSSAGYPNSEYRPLDEKSKPPGIFTHHHGGNPHPPGHNNGNNGKFDSREEPAFPPRHHLHFHHPPPPPRHPPRNSHEILDKPYFPQGGKTAYSSVEEFGKNKPHFTKGHVISEGESHTNSFTVTSDVSFGKDSSESYHGPPPPRFEQPVPTGHIAHLNPHPPKFRPSQSDDYSGPPPPRILEYGPQGEVLIPPLPHDDIFAPLENPPDNRPSASEVRENIFGKFSQPDPLYHPEGDVIRSSGETSHKGPERHESSHKKRPDGDEMMGISDPIQSPPGRKEESRYPSSGEYSHKSFDPNRENSFEDKDKDFSRERDNNRENHREFNRDRDQERQREEERAREREREIEREIEREMAEREKDREREKERERERSREKEREREKNERGKDSYSIIPDRNLDFDSEESDSYSLKNQPYSKKTLPEITYPKPFAKKGSKNKGNMKIDGLNPPLPPEQGGTSHDWNEDPYIVQADTSNEFPSVQTPPISIAHAPSNTFERHHSPPQMTYRNPPPNVHLPGQHAPLGYKQPLPSNSNQIQQQHSQIQQHLSHQQFPSQYQIPHQHHQQIQHQIQLQQQQSQQQLLQQHQQQQLSSQQIHQGPIQSETSYGPPSYAQFNQGSHGHGNHLPHAPFPHHHNNNNNHNNHGSHYQQGQGGYQGVTPGYDYPIYVTEPEPIIEIIVQDSNVTLPPRPTLPPPPPPPPPTPEPVHVFYVRYSTNNKSKTEYGPISSAANNSPPINLERPVQSINIGNNGGPTSKPFIYSTLQGLGLAGKGQPPPIIHNAPSSHHNHNEGHTTESPTMRPSTTLRAIIRPEKNEYTSDSRLKVVFDSYNQQSHSGSSPIPSYQAQGPQGYPQPNQIHHQQQQQQQQQQGYAQPQAQGSASVPAYASPLGSHYNKQAGIPEQKPQLPVPHNPNQHGPNHPLANHPFGPNAHYHFPQPSSPFTPPFSHRLEDESQQQQPIPPLNQLYTQQPLNNYQQFGPQTPILQHQLQDVLPQGLGQFQPKPIDNSQAQQQPDAKNDVYFNYGEVNQQDQTQQFNQQGPEYNYDPQQQQQPQPQQNIYDPQNNNYQQQSALQHPVEQQQQPLPYDQQQQQQQQQGNEYIDNGQQQQQQQQVSVNDDPIITAYPPVWTEWGINEKVNDGSNGIVGNGELALSSHFSQQYSNGGNEENNNNFFSPQPNSFNGLNNNGEDKSGFNNGIPYQSFNGDFNKRLGLDEFSTMIQGAEDKTKAPSQHHQHSHQHPQQQQQHQQNQIQQHQHQQQQNNQQQQQTHQYQQYQSHSETQPDMNQQISQQQHNQHQQPLSHQQPQSVQSHQHQEPQPQESHHHHSQQPSGHGQMSNNMGDQHGHANEQNNKMDHQGLQQGQQSAQHHQGQQDQDGQQQYFNYNTGNEGGKVDGGYGDINPSLQQQLESIDLASLMREENQNENVPSLNGLPDDVPDDLKQQLMSSGILGNADIQVINFDENLFKELGDLPPQALAALGGSKGQLNTKQPQGVSSTSNVWDGGSMLVPHGDFSSIIGGGRSIRSGIVITSDATKQKGDDDVKALRPKRRGGAPTRLLLLLTNDDEALLYNPKRMTIHRVGNSKNSIVARALVAAQNKSAEN